MRHMCNNSKVLNETVRELCERFIYSPTCLPDPRQGRAGKREYNQVYIVSAGTAPRAVHAGPEGLSNRDDTLDLKWESVVG